MASWAKSEVKKGTKKNLVTRTPSLLHRVEIRGWQTFPKSPNLPYVSFFLDLDNFAYS
jgi:hypothetical protein